MLSMWSKNLHLTVSVLNSCSEANSKPMLALATKRVLFTNQKGYFENQTLLTHKAQYRIPESTKSKSAFSNLERTVPIRKSFPINRRYFLQMCISGVQ